MKTQPLATLTDRVQPRRFEGHVLRAGFLGAEPAFVLADGAVHLGEREAIRPHADSILAVTVNQKRILTGGDDGKVIETRLDGTNTILADEKGRWIETLAGGPDGAVAWAVARQVKARDSKGKVKEWAAPSTPRGLAFAPKGYRLAIAHIDGASCWYPNTEAPADVFGWKGPHLDITFSPDNRFLITSMQENQLHGWRLTDKGHMRMSGYPAKTRCFSWSYDGLWFATSGAEAAIIWPFAGDGPTGKAPRECGIRPARVTQVAFHPRALILAIGYQDGWVILVRLTDAAELLVQAGGDGAPITTLAWDRDGKILAFGAESGAAGLVPLPV